MWILEAKSWKKIEKTLKIYLKLSKSPYFFHFKKKSFLNRTWELRNSFLNQTWQLRKSFLNQTTYVLKKPVVATIFIKSRFFLKSGFLQDSTVQWNIDLIKILGVTKIFLESRFFLISNTRKPLKKHNFAKTRDNFWGGREAS